MPRLIKKKYSQEVRDEENIGGDGARPEDVADVLKKRLLLMSGKLPALTPRSTPDSHVNEPTFRDTTELRQPLPSRIATKGSDGEQSYRDIAQRREGAPRSDASQLGQRCTVELGEEGTSGFRRRLSSGSKRATMEGNPMTSSPGVSAHQRAKKAMRDRLLGNASQRLQAHQEGAPGRFNDEPEKESFGKMRILALNDSSSDDSESEVEVEISKEAQEAEAYSLYNKALDLQRAGDNAEAESTYQQLLSIPLLAEVEPPDDEETVRSPGLMLKYLTYKNLGSMAYQKEDLNRAMEHYLEAVAFDETDVTVWYRIGTMAVTLYQLPLARLSFVQALKCSPNHWPSLDNLCTVLYALNDYAGCLFYICQALERDRKYKKGVVLREKMFKEQPSLRKDSYDLFQNCQDVIRPSQIDRAEAEKIIKEALTLREERRALAKREPMPLVKFLTPFTSFSSFTWKGLGERLVALYNHLVENSPPLSLCCKIDMSEYVQHPEEKEFKVSAGRENQITPAKTTQDTPINITEDTPPDNNQSRSCVPESKTTLSADDLQHGSEDNCDENFSLHESQQETVRTSGQGTMEQTPQQTQQQAPQQTLQGTQQIPSQETQQHSLHQAPLETPQQVPQETPLISLLDMPQQTPQQVHEQTLPCTQDQTPQQTPVGSSDIDDPVAMETEPIPVKTKMRRGPKRKREKANHPVPGNRRSTRVRNTVGKKKEECINYQEILRQFLPSSLQDSGEEREDARCRSSDQDEASQRQTPSSRRMEIADRDKPMGHVETDADQSEKVWEFLKKRQRNSGIIQLLDDYLREIVTTQQGAWPTGLTTVFLQAYSCTRRHVILPSIFSSEYSSELKTATGYVMLTFAELKIDELISAGKGTPTSVSKKADTEAMGKFIDEDLGYMQMLTNSGAIQEDKWRDFNVRVYWLKARYMTLLGKSEEAIDSFDECTDILSEPWVGEDGTERVITLPNCKVDNRITVDLIKEQLKSTQHSQSLEEVQRFYDAGNYERVTVLLLPTFQDTATSSRRLLKEGATPQRPSQLLLLHRSLLKLGDYKQCIICGAAGICEALQEVPIAKTPPVRDEWISVILELFEIFNKALCEDVDSLKQLERPQRIRLTSAIISAIEMCMDTDGHFPQDVLPWVVLYRVIKHEEDQLATMATNDDAGRCSTPMIPSSLMLLDTAHDYLGRRSWCCNSNGAFLRLYISVLSREIATGTEEDPHPFLSDLQYSLEQCFFCLHSHPSKKTKARHLQDHGVEELPMDMEDARLIFDYFKPSVLPEFDSYKTSSLSGDLESLLLKIVRIIPPMEDPPVTMEMLQAYVEAKTDEPPSIPADRPIIRPVVKEIYYLLADFYFKNKELFKAIKLYMQDLCVCPDRLDSWAGMALARSGRLELKFNMCDSKTEGTIYKHSVAALRCFQRALEIDRTNRSLWIEYGSMAYMVHSYASRQLKQREQFSLTEDIVEFLQEKRSECLGLAERCFEEARQCEVDGEEEEWLVHYMLGKVAEKRQTSPEDFLEHYKKAAYYLHEDEAKYPKKIAYHNPPDLSLEALEMYFRLHASILKLLGKPLPGFHGDYAMLQRYVLEAADEPFVSAQEKMDTSEPPSSADNDPDAKSPFPSIRVQLEGRGQADAKDLEVRPEKAKVPGSPLFVATPTDHDYVRSRGRKRQLVMTSTDSSAFPVLSRDEQSTSTSGLPPCSKDAMAGATSAAELLKSLAKIHTDILDQPAEKRRLLEAPPGPESVGQRTEPQADLGVDKATSSQIQEQREDPESVEGAVEEFLAASAGKQLGVEDLAEPDRKGLTEVKIVTGDATGEVEKDKTDSLTGERSHSDVVSGDVEEKGSSVSQQQLGNETPEEDVVTKEMADQLNETNPSIIVISSEESEDQMESEDSVPTEKQVTTETVALPTAVISEMRETGTEVKDVVTKEMGVQANEESVADFSVITISSEDSSDQMDLTEPRTSKNDKDGFEENLKTDAKEVAEDKNDKNADSLMEREMEGDLGEGFEKDEKKVEVREQGASDDVVPVKDTEQNHKDGLKMEAKADTEVRPEEKQEGKTLSDVDRGELSDSRQVEDEVKKTEAACGQSQEEQKAWLVERCLEAMKLCLSRFPQHYKSLYRMANAYATTSTEQGLQWSRDLLLGSNQPWQQTSHMPSPGLFAEHWKTKNLFHGVWRIPISEIDRSGSFSWHMYRSVSLLIDILRRLRDHSMLLQIAVKLNRTPELGKKFLRDVDRQFLARHCYRTCVEVLAEEIELARTEDKEQQQQVVLSAYRLVQTAQNKLQTDSSLPTKLLCVAYKSYRNIQIEPDTAVLDQAVRFCLQHRLASKTPQTPTSQPESIFSSPQPSKERSVIVTPDRQGDTQSSTCSSTQ
ncbi:calcineurin-binding protein cabin-1-like [Acanthaster planci]|uniref:Calcineurin-binding protein cabin-1-like n=1 Tax=Acanthaster planci TaxID=133434 RepID=A0A8B7YVF7_ACAPL|nr:calcineurin-binding protein cabin-1-like [Acanthaster planci]XP_022096466.1 calcineurin-binding protein cabin-1-like [Acanthaster planci]